MTTNLKLSPDELQKITNYEASISHWSSEYTVITLKARKMLEGIDSLYQARQKTLDDFLKANDINPAEVSNMNLGPNGEVTIELKDKK